MIQNLELNKQVAELMGWTKIRVTQGYGESIETLQGNGPHGERWRIPDYSGDMTAAWLVVEKLAGSGDCTFHLTRNNILPKEHRKDSPEKWTEYEAMFGYSGGKGARANGATAAEAICFAALKLADLKPFA